ncbi:MAG: RAMP superfamily CRISPR-associated protein [Candidatus Lokiarchaeota archaeon]
MKFLIKMELLSDTLPGDAESYGTYIDQDIVSDKDGIPYIPARRIKGILRKNADNLQSYLNLHPDEIFGKPGMNQEFFKISNGYIENYRDIKYFLKSIKINDNKSDSQQILDKIFNRDRISDFYTIIRTQTTIEDYIKGVAKENSLRTSRLLKKGLKFIFILNISNDKIKDDTVLFGDLKKICNISRHIGTNKNRGFGNISLNLQKEPDDNIEELVSQKGENLSLIEEILKIEEQKYIKLNFELYNTEPLIISPYVGLNSRTAFYIPGTMVLGVLASKFIKTNQIKDKAHENIDFKEIFLENNIIFSNFYFTCDFEEFQKRSIPIPKSLYKSKYGNEFLNLINVDLPLNKNLNNLDGYYNTNNLLELKNKDIVNLNTSINYHFQSAKDKSIGSTSEGEQNFFQYESIDANYLFSGSISGKSRYIKKLIKIFKKADSETLTIRLGKSRSAQYGNCLLKLKNYIIQNDNEEIKKHETNRFVIYLESDMILLNSHGYPDPNPKLLMRSLEDNLKLPKNSLKIKKQFIEKIELGGFSGIWGLPKIQFPALKKGSIFLIESLRNINLSKINEFYYGIKTNAGFGKIQIIPISDNYNLHLDSLKFEDLSESKFEQSKIKDFILSALDSYIIDRVNELAYNKANKYQKTYSNSELTRLKKFIKGIDNKEDLKRKFNALSEDGYKKFKPFHDILYLKSRNKKIEDITFNEKIADIVTKLIQENISLKQFSEMIQNNLLNSDLLKYYIIYYLKVLKFLEWTLKKGDSNE